MAAGVTCLLSHKTSNSSDEVPVSSCFWLDMGQVTEHEPMNAAKNSCLYSLTKAILKYSFNLNLVL